MVFSSYCDVLLLLFFYFSLFRSKEVAENGRKSDGKEKEKEREGEQYLPFSGGDR